MGSSMMALAGMALLGIVFQALKFSVNRSTRGNRKIARISERDSHLSFDERVAERMRELGRETERGEAPSPPRSVQGFGRRGA